MINDSINILKVCSKLSIDILNGKLRDINHNIIFKAIKVLRNVRPKYIELYEKSNRLFHDYSFVKMNDYIDIREYISYLCNTKYKINIYHIMLIVIVYFESLYEFADYVENMN
ncbi:MAG: hypothetical protein MJA82_07950 [Clostridia bacterium]|nr:hypothetical protein [Clostridia bacterium]